MATIEFWGGVGVIGGSKILVQQDGYRVLLDIGIDIPSGGDLFRLPVRPRPGRELADRLRLGAAPALPGLFAPEAMAPGSPLAEQVGETAVFVSHPHIDHVGLAGFVRPEVAVHAHTDAVDVLTALAATGQGLTHGEPDWQRLTDGQKVQVGPLEVECVPVDHDVPGASGYLVHTPDGTLVFTGDYRFHGHHPQRSWDFVDRAAGSAVLVTEGTTLGWDSSGRQRDETDVARDFARALEETAGLVLLSLYPRDVDRVKAFLAIAEAAGRRIVWTERIAAFLRLVGVERVLGAAEVPPAELAAEPGRYVLMPDPDDLPSLLDLPVGDGYPASCLVHANGEPLGPFEPRWAPFTDWLGALGIELRQIGCSGHASQDDLHHMLERMRPATVFPIHTTSPTRLHPPRGMRRVVAAYGTSYTFGGDPI
ncbi:MBL fold metallo-hydrolase [Kitasatospora sp. NBC_01287]|uniref:MBL fold metallo-hydrolase n=1 Tax=Kitasatospora sp. NBC_01287 TaxID=2903573 RepID=UPI0022507247|nr:MBL fold metallo-hydrolase [Kitasatospora sp. NBC_01287]MCX4750024.1 MBL fold metallo-hydrolase [Kitasatospora sp. NBC_01287]